MSATTSPPIDAPPSSSTLPPMSVLLSAPSLDPYISQLDEATLATLYNQPPPLGSSAASPSPTAVYSSQAAGDSLSRIDTTLATCIETAWKLSLQLDAGPDSSSTSSAADGTAATPLSLASSVTSFLTSLASLDAAARTCDLSVPQSLLDGLDEGRNPERGLAELLEHLISHNDRARGRAIATHALSEGIAAYVEVAGANEREAEKRSQAKQEAASGMEE